MHWQGNNPWQQPERAYILLSGYPLHQKCFMMIWTTYEIGHSADVTSTSACPHLNNLRASGSYRTTAILRDVTI
jgi:hypothetical protein